MKDLDNTDWVENQFKYISSQRTLRDVILHAAFIEQIVKLESRTTNFKAAITELKLRKCRGKIIENSLEEIERVRELRNDILHEIIKKQLSQLEIENKRNEMHNCIINIYNYSELVCKFFKEKYGFDPKNKVNDGESDGLQDS